MKYIVFIPLGEKRLLFHGLCRRLDHVRHFWVLTTRGEAYCEANRLVLLLRIKIKCSINACVMNSIKTKTFSNKVSIFELNRSHRITQEQNKITSFSL